MRNFPVTAWTRTWRFKLKFQNYEFPKNVSPSPNARVRKFLFFFLFIVVILVAALQERKIEKKRERESRYGRLGGRSGLMETIKIGGQTQRHPENGRGRGLDRKKI